MSYQLKNSQRMRFPDQKLAVKTTLNGQTDDDDWYNLEVYCLGRDGQLVDWGYPIKTNRLLKNIGEVKISPSGRTLIALEFDGDAVVWKQESNRRFDSFEEVYHVGSPISGLEIDDTDRSFTVYTHQGNKQIQLSLL